MLPQLHSNRCTTIFAGFTGHLSHAIDRTGFLDHVWTLEEVRWQCLCTNDVHLHCHDLCNVMDRSTWLRLLKKYGQDSQVEIYFDLAHFPASGFWRRSLRSAILRTAFNTIPN
jgi:hypothetical protein